MTEPKIEIIPGTRQLLEIEESFGSFEDITGLLAAIKGWRDPTSPDTLLDHDASLCKSLDGIASAIRQLADAVREKS